MTYWRTSRATSGGIGQSPGSPHAQNTPRDLHPLPAQSLRDDPLTDDDRSNIAGYFAVSVISFCFLIPMILAGVMFHFR